MSSPGLSADVLRHTRRMIDDFRHWTGRELLTDADNVRVGRDDAALAHLVYHLPYVLVSHGPGNDPIFTYGNRCAQTLWELDWDAFTRLPSRQSAEQIHVAERQIWLDTAARDGFVTGCHGIRIAASGRRFRISDVTIWNLRGDDGAVCGQVATYREWQYL